MRKGFFFTMDATIGIAMVALLLGGTITLGIASQKGGTMQALMHSNASDKADKEFLKGGSTKDVVEGGIQSANCKEVYDYVSGGKIGYGSIEGTPKVRKCDKLG